MVPVTLDPRSHAASLQFHRWPMMQRRPSNLLTLKDAQSTGVQSTLPGTVGIKGDSKQVSIWVSLTKGMQFKSRKSLPRKDKVGAGVPKTFQ
jgi:hypothetical protein